MLLGKIDLYKGINNMGKWANDDICHWFDEFNWNLIWAGRCIALFSSTEMDIMEYTKVKKLPGLLFLLILKKLSIA